MKVIFLADVKKQAQKAEIKGVKDVEHWLCARYSSLQKVIFGDSVEKLGEHAFSEY